MNRIDQGETLIRFDCIAVLLLHETRQEQIIPEDRFTLDAKRQQKRRYGEFGPILLRRTVKQKRYVLWIRKQPKNTQYISCRLLKIRYIFVSSAEIASSEGYCNGRETASAFYFSIQHHRRNWFIKTIFSKGVVLFIRIDPVNYGIRFECAFILIKPKTIRTAPANSTLYLDSVPGVQIIPAFQEFHQSLIGKSKKKMTARCACNVENASDSSSHSCS